MSSKSLPSSIVFDIDSYTQQVEQQLQSLDAARQEKEAELQLLGQQKQRLLGQLDLLALFREEIRRAQSQPPTTPELAAEREPGPGYGPDSPSSGRGPEEPTGPECVFAGDLAAGSGGGRAGQPQAAAERADA